MTDSKLAPLLVIEGIDGSGKGTQSRFVKDSLTSDGFRVALFSFPRYDNTFFGKRIGDFLNGAFGTLDQLDPFLISLLYAGDRFESREAIAHARSESDLVLFDRYVPSNIAHQTAKYDSPRREELRGWIEKIEYEIFGLPREDHAILLDTPTEVSQDLIARKSARSYTEQTADLQEADVPYLEKVRKVYLDLAELHEHWTIVPVADASGLRSINDVGQDVLTVARSVLS